VIRVGQPAGRVVCVGDVLLDIRVTLPAPLALGSDTPAPISFGAGGSAANTAAWLGHLGVPCAFAGRVGADAFGRDAVDALRAHGVVPMVAIDPAAPTGVCLVLVGPDGERTMVPSAGANAGLGPADLGTGLLDAADHLHLSGYTLLGAGCRPAALFALELAGSLGASVSVDAASAEPIRTVGPERFLEPIAPGTLLLANADELAALTGTADQEAGLAALVARGLDVVLKCGGAGSVLATSDGTWHSPAEPAEVLDTTGAGDAFAAGFLAAVHSGATAAAALAEGNRLGAVAVRRRGARPSE